MKYFLLILKHKWFVFIVGRKIGVSLWRLLKHDWTKFLVSELPHYNRQFFGGADDPLGFVTCWTRHQNRNDHHWEYWIPRTGCNRCTPPYKDMEPIPMAEQAVKEMVADWIGAGRAYEGKWPDLKNWEWYKRNYDKIIVHSITRDLINRIISNYNNEIIQDFKQYY
jgi:hypothetical protein